MSDKSIGDHFALDTVCPHCLEICTTASVGGGINDDGSPLAMLPTDRPEAGSLSLCDTCGNFAEFDESLQLKIPKTLSPVLVEMSAKAKAIIAKRRGAN